jgi:hypothetical protein
MTLREEPSSLALTSRSGSVRGRAASANGPPGSTGALSRGTIPGTERSARALRPNTRVSMVETEASRWTRKRRPRARDWLTRRSRICRRAALSPSAAAARPKQWSRRGRTRWLLGDRSGSPGGLRELCSRTPPGASSLERRDLLDVPLGEASLAGSVPARPRRDPPWIASTRRGEGADGVGEDTRSVVVDGLDERPMPAVEPLATDGLAGRDDDEPRMLGRRSGSSARPVSHGSAPPCS